MQNPLQTLLQVYGQAGRKEGRADRRYLLLTGLPLKPYFERRTIRTQISDDVYLFEQPQGFFNVTIQTRMVVVRLQSGDLWVHAPIAPTEECVRLLKEVGGEVKHIVLPTTALEHKLFVRPFSRAFPGAKVHAVPGQWSWPINIPFASDTVLRDGEPEAEWAAEIDQKLFSPPVIGVGPANEMVFFHKPSKSLIVTDCVVYVPQDPPAIVPEEELVESAYVDDEAGAPAELRADPSLLSTAEKRRGWEKMALQILFLGPAMESTFRLVSSRLLVSPVISTFVYSRVPESLLEFVDRVCEWDFRQVIPAHFQAPVRAGPREFSAAFQEFRSPPAAAGEGQPDQPWTAFVQALQGLTPQATRPPEYPKEDMKTLSFIDEFLTSSGIAKGS